VYKVIKTYGGVAAELHLGTRWSCQLRVLLNYTSWYSYNRKLNGP